MELKALSCLLIALCAGMAGCGAPDSVKTTFDSATSDVSTTASSLTDSIHDYSLVSLSITDIYSSPGKAPARTVATTSYSALDGFAKTTITNRFETHVDEGRVALAASALFQPISISIDLENATSVQQVVDGLQALVEPGAANKTVNYWLTAATLTETWLVTTVDLANGTTVRKLMDVATTTVSGTNATVLNPVVGALPSLDRLDVSFDQAYSAADLAATAWSQDSFPYSLVASESRQSAPWGGGGPVHFTFNLVSSHTWLPPDMNASDGKAPMWAFLYLSPSLNSLQPIFVYSAGIVVLGDVIAAPWQPMQVTYGVPLDIMPDSTILAGLVNWEGARMFATEYSADAGGGGTGIWTMGYGPHRSVWIYGDGTHVGCLALDCD